MMRLHLTTLLEPVNPGIKGRNLDVVLLTPFVVCQATLVAFSDQTELFLRGSPFTAHIRGPFRFANQNACYLAFLQSKMLASDILYPLQDECTTSLYSALTLTVFPLRQAAVTPILNDLHPTLVSDFSSRAIHDSFPPR
jgi:hypothetical protein